MSFTDILGLLRISLHAMVPLALTAAGEIVGETAGLFNIGLEGILLLSAFGGALAAEFGGAGVGLLVGMGIGGVPMWSPRSAPSRRIRSEAVDWPPYTVHGGA